MDFRKTLVIFKKDFGSYFNSPIAYVVVGAYLLVTGFIFLNAVLTPAGDQEASMRIFFEWASIMFVMFAPAITMRLLAEEKRSGTIQLLATLPVRDIEIVVGKFFAAMGLVTITLGLTLAYAFTVSSLGDLDWGPVWSGYLGLLLVCGAYVGIGLLASSLTENQIVAFILALCGCLFFYIIKKVLIFIPGGLVPFFEYISFDHHFQNIARGVIDSRAVIYFLSIIFLTLIGASQALERRKWATG